MRNSSLYFADVFSDLFLNYGHFPGVRVSRTLPAAAVPGQVRTTRGGNSAPSLAAGLPPQTPERQKIRPCGRFQKIIIISSHISENFHSENS